MSKNDAGQLAYNLGLEMSWTRITSPRRRDGATDYAKNQVIYLKSPHKELAEYFQKAMD